MSQIDLSQLKNKQVLITGGCGFIGSEVTKQLSLLGANITIIDNLSSGKKEYIQNLSNVTLINCDLRDEKSVKSAIKNKEYVINLAALPFIPDSYYYPKEFFDVNVNATISLVLSLIKHEKIRRFIHISSSEVYGSARYTPMDENHPTIPQSTYAVSKLAGERVVYTMHKEHDFPAVIIRPFNSFGPNITQPYIIPEIISQIIEGKEELKLGNVHSRRDLTYVSDTAKAIITSLLAEAVIGETINIGSGQSLIIKELVELISEIFSKKISISFDPSRLRPHDVDSLVCDHTKATNLLSWEPSVTINDGLKQTVDWVKQNHILLKAPFKGWTSAYRKDKFMEEERTVD